MYFDIIVIVPLETEFREFRKVFTLGENLTTGTLPTYKFDHAGITGLVILQDEMGYWGATRAANSISGEYNTGLIICAGIAGNLSTDTSIGDVCYSGTVIDTVTNGKIEDGSEGGEDVALSPDFFPTPKPLHGALTFLRVMPEYETAYQVWQQECLDNEKLEAESEGLKGYECRRPETYQGDIACGLVSKSKSYKNKLKGINRKILAIETESGAIARFASDNGYDFLAIRGICDNADDLKNELECRTKEVPRRAAAFNAFSFLKIQLETNHYFREYIGSRRPNADQSPAFDFAETPSIALADAQKTLLSQTVERLQETNQSFRTLPEGSLLPMPRVRFRPTQGVRSAQKDPMEFRQAVSGHQRIFATIPRVFPDKSLPWLIAHSLHYEQDDGRQLLPVVISGFDIRPPRGELSRLATVDIEKIQQSGGTVVFIIDDFPVRSKSNAKFLATEMHRWPESRFVVLCHDTPDIKDVEDFVATCDADHAEIVDTSFAEITVFLATHFALAAEQAQVIALKLTELFRKFGLQVHPTFFAGIPQELISSLLEANKRGELIQLAVDGYLTHVVAGDREKGRLSRTTRADFLRMYIRALKIGGQRLTRADIQEMTSTEFAKRKYPNDPELFIERFIDTNVLIEVDGHIEFGLTFMEAYFTALEVGASGATASAYFDPEKEDFDFTAFDLYSELRAHETYIDAMIEHLVQLPLLNQPPSLESPLRTNQINPKLMRQRDVTQAVQARIDIAQKAISEGRDETKEKQRLLDVADRVFVEARGSRHDAENADTPDEEVEEISRHLKVWYLAVVLLGQGAERLMGDRKDRLAAIVSRLSARILDAWISHNSRFDFDALRIELTKEENIVRLIDPTLVIPSTLKPEDLIAALVDIAEMSILSGPIPVVLGHLADEANQRVLLPSLLQIEPEDFLEKIVRASWLGETDAAEAKSFYVEMCKELPDSRFLRSILCAYYVMRVYWNMPSKPARLQLLSIANDIMKPLGRKLDVRGIEQSIERSAED